MALHSTSSPFDDARQAVFSIRIPVRLIGALVLLLAGVMLAALASWKVDDPSLSFATTKPVENWLGFPGAAFADIAFQLLGLAAPLLVLPMLAWGYAMVRKRPIGMFPIRALAWIVGGVLATALFSCFAVPESWPLPLGLGGFVGTGFSGLAALALGTQPEGFMAVLVALLLLAPTAWLLAFSAGLIGRIPDRENLPARREPTVSRSRAAEEPEDDGDDDERDSVFAVAFGYCAHLFYSARVAVKRLFSRREEEFTTAWHAQQREPLLSGAARSHGDFEPSLDRAADPGFDSPQAHDSQAYDSYGDYEDYPVALEDRDEDDDDIARLSVEQRGSVSASGPRVVAPAARPLPSRRVTREAQASFLPADGFELPPLDLLAMPAANQIPREHMPEQLEANAKKLEGVLEDFGVKGDIINVRPGPVVTLYELEPAPGIKSSRVISLADDIARSMSAISARVAVVPGRNAIGIELPNQERETVFLRELLDSTDYEKAKARLPICLGKTIGGEPIIVDLARMPHLLIAGTTGSGKSVGINTMILSLLYKMTPEQCRLIMIDPKMLELSIYDGIPHLLTPVVTDPAKAVVALKWAVREMEDRYKKMSKVGVRNIDGFNQRVGEAAEKGEVITRTVQTGFDRETGEPIFESEQFDLEPLPYIVVIVDEMADLMMVAGKDIEGTIQRLAQMARAAGIHIIMATQRPSVDVITGTIKANFPTRVSFQVTSKIDSRTILGEQGAEQLLGHGDMLYMAGGGRIKRLHGAFVADREVEDIVSHLKSQGTPEYLDSITSEDDEAGAGGFDEDGGFGGSGDELYDKAVNVVLADKKASTSYIQRRLSIGYNRAATLIERMEQEGIISPANHAGKREVLVGDNADGY